MSNVMSNVMLRRTARFGTRSQRGMTTLLVTLSILIILTIIVLGSYSVALFEQKTATNENRERLAEQAAEYALSLAGEFMKTNVSKISTNAPGGWLDELTASNVRWQSCAPFTDTVYAAASAIDKTHPCYAERSEDRRVQLFYYTTDGATHTAGGATELNLFPAANAQVATAAKLTSVGGTTSAFPAQATVSALLCRVDSTPTLPENDHCRLHPARGRSVAVTLISTSTLSGENAGATVKETWGTVITRSFAASTPLVASGSVKFVGNFTIVTAPNAGGYGIPASVWTPSDFDGNGTFQTCFVEDYIDAFAPSQLTTSPGCMDKSSCSCDKEVLSQKTATDGVDILDFDLGKGTNPDISFFPGGNDIGAVGSHAYGGTRFDYQRCTGPGAGVGPGAPYADCVSANTCGTAHPYCDTDDNLFEWIFGVDVTGGDNADVKQNCGSGATDCEVQALTDLNFKFLSCLQFKALGAIANGGLYYITDAAGCNFGTSGPQMGTPDHPIILVVNLDVDLGKVENFFGMIFVRSDENRVDLKGSGNGKIFGSIVAEGSVAHMTGTVDVVYMDTSAGNPDDPLPDTTRFARLPNSWLDNTKGF